MGAIESRSDDELILETAPSVAGSAFAEFYRRHEQGVVAYFRRRTASPELAADLAAETFAQALSSRRRFRRRGTTGGSSVAWLYGIASNVLARSIRRGRVEDRARLKLGLPVLVLDDERLDAIAEIGTDSGAREALESLPAHQRDAVWARVVQERPYPEIAVELECSESVVRKRVSRGLQTLRQTMEESA